MRSVVVVVVFPFPKLLVEEVDVVGDSALIEKLVKFLVVDAVRAFHLAVQPWRAWLDVDVLDVLVAQVPVECGLKLRAVVRLDHVDPKRQTAGNFVDELSSRLLGTRVIDLQNPDASAVVDGGELVEPPGRAWDALQELNVDLHAVSGLLLLVPLPLVMLALVLLAAGQPV